MDDETESTPDRIAIAALELLREKGAEGLSMRQVAVRSDLVLSNVQYHYPSREKLLVGITQVHIRKCQLALERGVAERGSVSLRSILEVALLDEELVSIAEVFRDLFALALNHPSVDNLLKDYYRESHEKMATFLAEESSKSFEECAPVATILMSAIEGVYLIGDATPVDRETIVDGIERMVMSQLR